MITYQEVGNQDIWGHLGTSTRTQGTRLCSSLLVDPGLLSCWPLGCTGAHASLPVVLVGVEPGDVAPGNADRGGGFGLDHDVGSCTQT